MSGVWEPRPLAAEVLRIVWAFGDQRRKDLVRALARRVDQLEGFVEELAEEPCTYGDGCPDSGANHGRCLHCKARRALGRA